MPLTPDEAIEKNKGKKHLQLERAIQDLLAETEEAVAYYTGNPIYVGLPAYLQYKLQADNARETGHSTLHDVDSALHAVDSALLERFGPSGWRIGIVTNETQSYFWARLRDDRED
jgi:hypothetical protein